MTPGRPAPEAQFRPARRRLRSLADYPTSEASRRRPEPLGIGCPLGGRSLRPPRYPVEYGGNHDATTQRFGKLSQIIVRIQRGRFDANDVDGLLIKLRPYARSRNVFREISHFVAHSDARDQGMALESIMGFVDSMRFFQEYTGPKRPLDLGAPFPAYVYRLFLSQARLADKQQLKTKFKMSQDTLINKIKATFEADAYGSTCSLRSSKGGTELFEALQYVNRPGICGGSNL